MDCLAQVLLDPGDEIVCGWPSFSSYVIDAQKMGAVPRLVPLRDHRYDLDAMLDGDRPAHEDRLRLLPEQPDGHGEHRAELDRVLRVRARPRLDRDRPGVLRVRRRPGLRRCDRDVLQGRVTTCSSCARSRRSTAWPGCASGTAWGPRRSCASSARCGARSTCRRRARRPRWQASTTPRRSSVGGGDDRGASRALGHPRPGTASSLSARPSANFLYADIGDDAHRPAVRRACCARA